MINTIIVDDELASIQSLQRDIKRAHSQVNIIATFQDPIEALAYLRSTTIDLIFLDLDMPKMHGFELLENLDNIDFNIIFVTAYDEFALRAFEFNAVDYILKPPIHQKLNQAIEKVLKRKASFDTTSLGALVNNLQLHHSQGIEKIAIPSSYGWEFVHINDIIYLKADGNYTNIFLINKEKYLVAKTLKSMNEMLNFESYFRSHQSYLVNLNHAKKYYRGSGGYLLLSNGEKIPVARTKREELSLKMRL